MLSEQRTYDQTDPSNYFLNIRLKPYIHFAADDLADDKLVHQDASQPEHSVKNCTLDGQVPQCVVTEDGDYGIRYAETVYDPGFELLDCLHYFNNKG